jgi:hypothetical protein
MRTLIPLLLITLGLVSCEKFFEFEQEIDFSQGNTTKKIVVQAVMQPGFPAYALLTQSEPYFDPVTAETINSVFVEDASITVKSEDGDEVPLVNILDLNISDFSQDEDLINLFDSLQNALPGLYIQPTPPFTFAQADKSYSLEIIRNEDTLTATTTIPSEHPMDSVWFVVDENAPRPNLGNFWFHYSDPDTLGNTIMIEHKRLFHTKETQWGENPQNGIEPFSVSVNNIEDPFFVKALWGFVRNDFEGLNGTSFDTYLQRGTSNNILFDTSDQDFEQEENGYFKSGQSILSHDKDVFPDTVLLRFSQIDYESYLFWRSVDYQNNSGGNPFAEPINLQSNVNNGYGIFYGQSAIYYKVIAKEDTIYTERFYPSLFEIF